MIASGLTSLPNMPILPNREISNDQYYIRRISVSLRCCHRMINMSRLLGEPNQPLTWNMRPLKPESRFLGLSENLEVVLPLF